MHLRNRFRGALVACAATCASAALSSAQPPVREIAGRVVADSGAPIPNATIVITAVRSAESHATTTDSAGIYHTSLPGVAAEYVVFASAAGRQSQHQRVVPRSI